jgi:hypothetical protein
VDHPPRGTDDCANAVCGALWLASKLQFAGRSKEAFLQPSRCIRDYDPFDPQGLERARRSSPPVASHSGIPLDEADPFLTHMRELGQDWM